MAIQGCASWCHWKEENCFSSACKKCSNCDALLAETTREVNAPAELPHRSQINPDSSFFHLSGYALVHRENKRVFFDNRFTKALPNDSPPTTSPGTRVAWKSDAEYIVVYLYYKQRCDERCPTDGNKCYFRGSCSCACRVKLFVDGRRVQWQEEGAHGRLPTPGEFFGPQRIIAMQQQSRVQHDFELVWPWCATSIEFRGLTLHSASPGERMHKISTPHKFKLQHIAFGDSITAGWCGGEHSYPELLALWNDWLSVNVAVPGLALTWNKFRWLAPEEAGKGLARLGDLATDHSLMILTIMLGTNDCGMGKENEVGHPLAALLDSFRQRLSHVPIAIITPIVGYCSDRMESLRMALEATVQGRHDPQILLIDGRILLPANSGYFIASENPHPNALGIRELALDLEAQLGFGRLNFRRTSCSTTTMHLQVEGLMPGGAFAVLYGNSSVYEGTHAKHFATCAHRTLMLKSKGHVFGEADDQGHAHVVLPVPCLSVSWQVLDLISCESSRLGSDRENHSRIGSLSAMLPKTIFAGQTAYNMQRCGRTRRCEYDNVSGSFSWKQKKPASPPPVTTPMPSISPLTYSRFLSRPSPAMEIFAPPIRPVVPHSAVHSKAPPPRVIVPLSSPSLSPNEPMIGEYFHEPVSWPEVVWSSTEKSESTIIPQDAEQPIDELHAWRIALIGVGVGVAMILIVIACKCLIVTISSITVRTIKYRSVQGR